MTKPPRGSTCAALASAILIGGLLPGCSSSPDPQDAATDSPPDAPCPRNPSRPVDILVMLDDSGDMVAAVTRFASAVRSFADRLTRSTCAGGLGLDDIHLGVTTANYGADSFGSLLVGCANRGDDGVLLSTAACGEDGNFLTVAASPTLGAAAECLVGSRTSGLGCGYEMPLDATARALLPDTSTLDLRSVVGGQGGAGANAGFLRDDSVLVVLLLTSEDDCSVVDAEFLDPFRTDFRRSVWELSLRCFYHQDAEVVPGLPYLSNPDRYAQALISLRGDPADVVVALVTGVGPSLIGDPASPAIASWLADPSLVEAPDPTPEPGFEAPTLCAPNVTSQPGVCWQPMRLLPSCTCVGDPPGSSCPPDDAARPPRRLLDFAGGLETAGANVLVGSICDDYAPTLDAVATAIGSRARPVP